MQKELERGYRYPGERTCAGDGSLDELPSGGDQYGGTDAWRRCRQSAVLPSGVGHVAGIRCPPFHWLKAHSASGGRWWRTGYRTRAMTSVTKGLHARWDCRSGCPSMPRAYRIPDARWKTPAPEPDKVVYRAASTTMGLTAKRRSRAAGRQDGHQPPARRAAR